MLYQNQQVNTVIRKYQQPQADDSDSLMSLSDSEPSFSIVYENDMTDSLYQLKGHVLELLTNYQNQLSDPKNDFKTLKNKLTKDACELDQKYKELKIPENTSSETKLVIQVIEEFILKFAGIQKTYQIQAQPTKKQFENDISTFLQISNISNINFQEETFYKTNSYEVVQQRLHSKIERLKIVRKQLIKNILQRLEKALQKQQLSNTRNILKDSIEQLDRILESNNMSDIKKIVYKLEQSIKTISDNQSGEHTINLYNLLQKVIHQIYSIDRRLNLQKKKKNQDSIRPLSKKLKLNQLYHKMLFRRKSKIPSRD